MYQLSSSATVRAEYLQSSPDRRLVEVVELDGSHEREVRDYLARRPIYTVAMVGLINDNGLVSSFNRGTFFGCRNRLGQLEGVALIGHATLIETTSDRALEAFASIAQTLRDGHLIMGETQRINEFWAYYADEGQDMRHACREMLFELRWPIEAGAEVPGLRLATSADLELVLPVQAQMAFDESGVNPSEQDPMGFRQRCARRITQGRTWVSVEAGKLIFKADIVSDTSSVMYLEGVWTKGERRSQGYGLRCMSQLARLLLARTQSVCVLVNEKNMKAQRFYQRAGYKCRAVYDTIFLL
jgi:uncharacterized protein